ncbi:MAG TPA: histone deacetylase family protein [Alphaproteobacteria bacterium]|jgi:acetoin utilization deacetylase AcuC-like enzyme|nr:histone deacetylase family protein [Alphaproteobacteria bacterium]
MTVVFTHPACHRHDMGYGHPESPERLRAVIAALEDESFAPLIWELAPLARREQVLRVHARDYFERLERTAPQQGTVQLDADTAMSADTFEAALRAAGAACAAVDEVMTGKAANAFCAVRPPGHHAEPDQAMGFCFFNNVAVAALHARARHGIHRIAVVDFDVHHGNGTQAMFEADGGLLYLSSHQSPLYPGTGAASERGMGNIWNGELPPGAGSREFRQTYEYMLLPALDEFRPELLLVSAGFDGHARDPLAQLRLSAADYGWVTRQLLEVARRHCGGRVVSTLEGGYDLVALAESSAEHVRALMQA